MGNMALVAGSWLVPGLGFIVKRDYWRGMAIFLILNGTFALGLLLHGTILIPEFDYRDPAFNIVNLLTFVGELGNAGASLLRLAYDHWKWGDLNPLPVETHAWFDLAVLYLLVSGCMNYFCVCSFYDRYVARTVDETESKGK